MPLFDTYVMVDWSAKATPSPWPPGEDSIWWAAVQDRYKAVKKLKVRIPPAESIVTHERTRYGAIENITKFLEKEIEKDRRVLLGFDFAFGYPMGFAERITGQRSASSLWKWMSKRIVDDTENRNNRFDVAAQLNRRVAATVEISDGPFWGFFGGERKDYRPGKDPYSETRKEEDRRQWPLQCWPEEFGFARRRITDEESGATPVWKLSQSDSVGSQVLVGLPWLHRLRGRFLSLLRDKGKSRCVVWPFETGFSLGARKNPEIVIVEIYPSLIQKAVDSYRERHEVKDRAQVRLNALAFALLGEDGTLEEMFRGPEAMRRWQDPNKKKAERDGVKKEEGWILGVGDGDGKIYKECLARALDEHFSTDGEGGEEAGVARG